MKRIITDPILREKLLDFQHPLELCDETGKTLARLIPVYDPSEFGPLEPQVSEVELRRREKSDKWYTTAQVLAHLNNLGKSKFTSFL